MENIEILNKKLDTNLEEINKRFKLLDTGLEELIRIKQIEKIDIASLERFPALEELYKLSIEKLGYENLEDANESLNVKTAIIAAILFIIGGIITLIATIIKAMKKVAGAVGNIKTEKNISKPEEIKLVFNLLKEKNILDLETESINSLLTNYEDIKNKINNSNLDKELKNSLLIIIKRLTDIFNPTNNFFTNLYIKEAREKDFNIFDLDPISLLYERAMDLEFYTNKNTNNNQSILNKIIKDELYNSKNINLELLKYLGKFLILVNFNNASKINLFLLVKSDISLQSITDINEKTATKNIEKDFGININDSKFSKKIGLDKPIQDFINDSKVLEDLKLLNKLIIDLNETTSMYKYNKFNLELEAENLKTNIDKLLSLPLKNSLEIILDEDFYTNGITKNTVLNSFKFLNTSNTKLTKFSNTILEEVEKNMKNIEDIFKTLKSKEKDNIDLYYSILRSENEKSFTETMKEIKNLLNNTGEFISLFNKDIQNNYKLIFYIKEIFNNILKLKKKD